MIGVPLAAQGAPGAPPVPPAQGLSSAEAAARAQRGQSNVTSLRATRRVRDIIGRNVVTPFTLILGALLVATLVIGPVQDAAFGVVLVANILIGTVQELRAKRALDRLSVLVRAPVVARRDGRDIPLDPDALVLGDVVVLTAGDQVPADAGVLAAEGLEVDESLLTGEAEPVLRSAGDRLLAGSVVVAGRGTCAITAVGDDAYGQRLATEARRRRPLRSELMTGTNRLLVAIALALGPLGVLLVISQVSATETTLAAVRSSIAGLVTLIPQGLVLLTSVAFAVGVVRLVRHGVLASELAAVEPLARVDVLCIDKTGTLTTGELDLGGIDSLGGAQPAETALANLAAGEPDGNTTARALRSALGLGDWTAVRRMPFSARRRWSGAEFEGQGTWLLGAPDVVGAGSASWHDAVDRRLSRGERVLLLCRSTEPLGAQLPAARHAVAVVGFREALRGSAAATVSALTAAGITIKVVSGDDAGTAASVARRAGIPIASPPVNVAGLADAELAAAAREAAVLGRVGPREKLAVVHALQAAGHVVAMTGDGVNDVLALRDADIGIAMGSGAAAARAVARLVIVDRSLASFPQVLAEGRRVLANVERAAALFVTKTVFAAVLILCAAWAALPFPLLLRQLTLVDAVAIGIPSLVLALLPGEHRWHPGFLRRTLALAIPTGIVSGLATAIAYEAALHDLGESLAASRTVAALVLAACALWLVWSVSRDTGWIGRCLVAAMILLLAAVVTVAGGSSLTGMEAPTRLTALVAVGVASAAIAAMELGWRAWRLARPSRSGAAA